MEKVTSIKYLLWDIDGTLLNFEFAEDKAIHSCFRDFKLGNCSNQMLETYKVINKKYWYRLECGEISKKEVLEGRFREFFSVYGFDLSIVSQFNQAYQIYLGNIVCYNTHAEETKKVLKTIIKHCNTINETKEFFGNNYSKFENNIIYQNSILTPVTQIGELVKKLSLDFRTKYNKIPWKNIAGMRDIVVHNYETIDKSILWNVADEETDKIKEFCQNILKEVK